MRKTMLLRGCFYGLGLFLLPAPVFLLAGTAAGNGNHFFCITQRFIEEGTLRS